jgi:hypothetical protein
MKTGVTVYSLVDLENDSSIIVSGTINDLRNFAKTRWEQDQEFIQDIFYPDFEGELLEEEFYQLMDDDLSVLRFLESYQCDIEELCVVPLDDFYDEEKPSQELIDEVLEQIKKDVAGGDVTAIEELLMHVPLSKLGGYLPE